jgi:hypothetical protein
MQLVVMLTRRQQDTVGCYCTGTVCGREYASPPRTSAGGNVIGVHRKSWDEWTNETVSQQNTRTKRMTMSILIVMIPCFLS